MTAANAIYCRELSELMVDSGRRFLVPPKIADTVKDRNPDPRYVKRWAVIHNLISSDDEVIVHVPT
ncbi:hypothetical protein FAS41_30440 [Pseudomonas nicosulfuronedens]|uniref:Uncharacterized protein n=1 Tax=Pseudomonas nicosulfuronedens TaxID=2571105 RepID=A0A5R9QKC0_9PSED|nr:MULTISPECIES: hypothetical protein [Pseudomonas]TLX69660.1 hypothetical protein FAS41_30440 [Pseudomonas nicosulfuronedens]